MVERNSKIEAEEAVVDFVFIVVVVVELLSPRLRWVGAFTVANKCV